MIELWPYGKRLFVAPLLKPKSTKAAKAKRTWHKTSEGRKEQAKDRVEKEGEKSLQVVKSIPFCIS